MSTHFKASPMTPLCVGAEVTRLKYDRESRSLQLIRASSRRLLQFFGDTAMLRFQAAVIALMGVFLAVANCSGQPTNETAAALLRTLSGTNSIALNRVPAGILRVLDDEDPLKSLAVPLMTTVLQTDHTNGLLGFINDWHLRPKFFHAPDSASDDSVLGFEYHYQKSIANRVFDETWKNPMGISLAVEAQGDVAVEASKNPNNLLETSAELHLFQGLGGIDPQYKNSAEAAAEFQRELMKNIQDEDFRNQRGKAYGEMAKKMTAHIRPQLFWDLQAHGTLEADQQILDKQWAYGGKLSFAFRDWKSKSTVGWFNVLDYPFAAVRWLVDKEEFQPSGRTFPSVVLGLDLVDPSDNDSRLAIDPDTDAFPRGRIELAFKTRMLRWQNKPLYFSAAFRYFQEFGASSAIKAANLDRSDYFVARLDLPYRFNISFANGKLPLDGNNDQVYAIGWALNF